MVERTHTMTDLARRRNGMRSTDELRKADVDELRGLRDMAQNALYDLTQFVQLACERIEAFADENERLEGEADENTRS